VLSGVLAFAGAAGWVKVVRRRRSQDSWITIVAGIAITIIFAAMATVPWRIIYDSEFPVAFAGDDRCYVVQRADRDALLICPWRDTERRVVMRSDELQPNHTEKIFSAIADRLRSPGGQ
jgi:hypothetical protein